MCGICGMVGFVDERLLKSMCDAMRHRGPDDEGYFVDNNAGLGMKRLSIIDLGGGRQPIYNEDKTVTIVFNGEIYNYKELAEELRKRGHKFYTNSDTEVIVHLYEDLKEECVNKLRGMFAFAVWDRKEEKLFLARDRLGIKPLYYACQNNKLLFASEIKPFLEDTRISKEINFLALDYYLSFLYIPAPWTIFKSIDKLKPGHILTFKKGSLNIKRYWDKVGSLQECPKSWEFYRERIPKILEETVKCHLVSDTPIGVFLSGGMDSSAIVAFMRRLGVPSIRTFSIGYEGKYSSYNELDYSSLAAKKFNTQHKEFIIKPDITDVLPKVVNSLEEPFADSSAIITYLISREVSRHVKVALSGIGGDEVFGGYPRYIGAQLSLYYQRLPYFLRKGLAGLSGFLPESTSSTNTGGRIKRFLKSGLMNEEDRYISWLTVFNKDAKDKLYSRMKSPIDNYEPIHKQFFQECEFRRGYLDKIFYVDTHTYLPDDLLIMADRMSMANSLEVRVPFCDHELIEFMASVPYHLRIKGFKIKSLLKTSLKGILPEEVIQKPKRGFMLPMGDWIKEDLKDFVSDSLSREAVKKRGILNYDSVKTILDAHFKGRGLFTDHIYALLVLELWFRNYIDK